MPKGVAYDYVETEYGGHAIQLTKEAIANGYTCIAAAGGDGTVNEIASVLVDSQTSLAIIPMGSGNGLARHNHIPMKLKNAFQLLKTGKNTAIDAGIINDRYFFCAAGIGFDALVSEKFAHSQTRGLISYFLIALEQYFSYNSKMYDIEIDGKKWTRKSFFISFANANQFGNHAYIAPHAKIDDEKLEICLLKPFVWWQGFKLMQQLFNKTIQESPLYESFSGKKITIKSDHPISFHFDGEPISGERSEVNITVKPLALQLRTPL